MQPHPYGMGAALQNFILSFSVVKMSGGSPLTFGIFVFAAQVHAAQETFLNIVLQN